MRILKKPKPKFNNPPNNNNISIVLKIFSNPLMHNKIYKKMLKFYRKNTKEQSPLPSKEQTMNTKLSSAKYKKNKMSLKNKQNNKKSTIQNTLRLIIGVRLNKQKWIMKKFTKSFYLKKIFNSAIKDFNLIYYVIFPLPK